MEPDTLETGSGYGTTKKTDFHVVAVDYGEKLKTSCVRWPNAA